MHSSEVPARLALAAVNGSLVGILLTPAPAPAPASEASEEGGGAACGGAPGAAPWPAGVRRVDLSLPAASGGRGGGASTRVCSILFDEAHSGGGPTAAGLAPCVGLGIVRCVDVEKSLLYLITPTPPTVLRGEGSETSTHVILVRSALQLPPALLYCPDGQPAHPYMSGEVTGEGAAAMKARTNVKRRSQHPR